MPFVRFFVAVVCCTFAYAAYADDVHYGQIPPPQIKGWYAVAVDDTDGRYAFTAGHETESAAKTAAYHACFTRFGERSCALQNVKALSVSKRREGWKLIVGWCRALDRVVYTATASAQNRVGQEVTLRASAAKLLGLPPVDVGNCTVTNELVPRGVP